MTYYPPPQQHTPYQYGYGSPSPPPVPARPDAYGYSGQPYPAALPPSGMPPPAVYMPQGGLYAPHQPLYLQPHPSQPRPRCRYGAACRRAGCVYEHPPVAQAPPAPSPSSRVCLAFLTGTCRFGSGCMYRHPRCREENRRTKERLATIPCRHGEQCPSRDVCLFYHEEEQANVAADA